jgi:membrane-bound metal-dependent hydrolase YbcI (DUF457 family)
VAIVARSQAMIAGHFGFAAGVKARAPATPLWLLMLACQWLDVVFVVLFAAHLEGLAAVPGAAPGAYGGAVIHAYYTHSLVGAAVLSAVLGGATAWRYGRRSGVVIALVAFSHWVLDLVMHRPDMPILPGDSGPPLLGFGLWRSPVASAVVELIIVVVGTVMYWRAARALAPGSPDTMRRANLCGALALVAGLTTLGLNVAGM